MSKYNLNRNQDVVAKKIVRYYEEMTNNIYKEVRKEAVAKVREEDYSAPLRSGFHVEYASTSSEMRDCVKKIKTERPDYSDIFKIQ